MTTEKIINILKNISKSVKIITLYYIATIIIYYCSDFDKFSSVKVIDVI